MPVEVVCQFCGGTFTMQAHKSELKRMTGGGVCARPDCRAKSSARVDAQLARFAPDWKTAVLSGPPPCAHVSPEVAAAFALDRLAAVAPHLVKIDLPNS
jgi:hypothetical protein